MESMTVNDDGSPSTDLLDIVEAVQLQPSSAAPLELGEPEADSTDEPHLTVVPTPHSRSVREAIADANPDRPHQLPLVQAVADDGRRPLPAVDARAAAKARLDEIAAASRARRSKAQ